MRINDKVWQTEAVTKTFLEGVRGAIPLAAEQIDVMLRIIQSNNPKVDNFLDLGCGDGILGRAILAQYPDAKGVFVDFSEPMLQAAKSKLINEQHRIKFFSKDFGTKEWINNVDSNNKFDVVVSGFAIHHQPDIRKKEIYQEIYGLLKPGGIFLNLEHISSLSEWSERINSELFIDALYAFHQKKGSHQSKDEIAQNYYNRADKGANILAPVEVQCSWLRELGFIYVDCFMKLFEIALFGGIKPE